MYRDFFYRGKMKKYFFMIVLILNPLFLHAKAENSRSYIEIFGAYDQITMSDYNTLQQDMQDVYNYFGIISDFKRMDTAVLAEISYVYNLHSLNAGEWGVYFRGGRLNALNESKLYYTGGTQVLEKLESDYSVFYCGFGLRKYIAAFYIGADACAYLNSGNREKDSIYYSDGSLYQEFEKKWDTALYGFDFEAGMDMWLSDSLGISFRGGYRYAKGSIDINWGDLYGNAVTPQKVDYSGLYIGAGLMIALGQDKEEPLSIKTDW
jgi:hypothetical protein